MGLVLTNDKIAKIYENIYNIEIENRYLIDNKFSSRLTILIALLSAFAIILTSIMSINEKNNIDYIINSFIQPYPIIFVICLIILLSLLLLCYCFFRCFFRTKMNYRVMPTIGIRMFHFYIHRNNYVGTNEENELYSYMIDSYQFCAFNNSQVNTKREAYLIKYDILASISFILLIITYSMLSYYGFKINWIFS